MPQPYGCRPITSTTSWGTEMAAEYPQWLLELEHQFQAEDREGRRRERERKRLGLPEPKREVVTFEGWADTRVEPRT